jgi:hypothetical protein
MPAINTKRLLHQHPTGVISTVFPVNSTNAGRPYAIMEVSHFASFRPYSEFDIAETSSTPRHAMMTAHSRSSSFPRA